MSKSYSDKYNDESKARQFNEDCKIMILSLKDAIKCTDQIAKVKADRANASKYFKKFNSIITSKELLLTKLDKYPEIGPTAVIAAKSLDSAYTYFLYKYAFKIYASYIANFDRCKDFESLNKELESVHSKLKSSLRLKLQESYRYK